MTYLSHNFIKLALLQHKLGLIWLCFRLGLVWGFRKQHTLNKVSHILFIDFRLHAFRHKCLVITATFTRQPTKQQTCSIMQSIDCIWSAVHQSQETGPLTCCSSQLQSSVCKTMAKTHALGQTVKHIFYCCNAKLHMLTQLRCTCVERHSCSAATKSCQNAGIGRCFCTSALPWACMQFSLCTLTEAAPQNR